MRRVGVAVAAVVAVAMLSAQAGSGAPFTAATAAWDRGNFVEAIDGYLRILDAPDADRFFEAIALQTGELYRTRTLTDDGRAPQFSPDGAHIAFETGLEVSRATTIVKNDRAFTRVAELPGISATFSRLGDRVAYLKIDNVPEVQSAFRLLDDTPLAVPNRTVIVREAAWETVAHTSIAVRNLRTGQEHDVPAPGLMKTGLVYAADGTTLYFLGATDAAAARTDIYQLADGDAAPTFAVDAPGLKGVPILPPRPAMATGDRVLAYVIPGANLFRRPGQPGGRTAEPRFAVVDMETRQATIVSGFSPVLSRGGSALAYVRQMGEGTALMAGPPLGQQSVVAHSSGRIDAPAFSGAADLIAYQKMDGGNWDIYESHVGPGSERRVTSDVQHDVSPHYVSRDRLIAAIGEPRHRRSFLYDRDGTRTRLFHNNTIRTIAPEYQWVVSDDGQQILVGAERDGDTVSPERGVYLVDLRSRITRADLRARLAAQRAAEVALREAGRHMFEPIADEVRSVVERVSTDRISGYEGALVGFGSKYLSQPGNRQASDFLFDAYTSFGYEPRRQWFEAQDAIDGRTANVIATLRGTGNPDLVYVVSSHYDSVVAGPGADDDSSGTSALLEAARVLAEHPLPATVVFASFTGEEAGLLGSREFVRQAVQSHTHVVGALNNDMIGWTNDAHLDNTIRYSNPGIRDVQHAGAFLFTKLITYDAVYFKGTDAGSYYDAYGDIVGGFGSYPVLSNPNYHQAGDVVDTVNPALITETSKATVATIMLLASSPSRITGLQAHRAGGAATAISWAPSPEADVVSYRVTYGPASDPTAREMRVSDAQATIATVASGMVVAVKAVNRRGLEGWDWARITIW